MDPSKKAKKFQKESRSWGTLKSCKYSQNLKCSRGRCQSLSLTRVIRMDSYIKRIQFYARCHTHLLTLSINKLWQCYEYNLFHQCLLALPLVIWHEESYPTNCRIQPFFGECSRGSAACLVHHAGFNDHISPNKHLELPIL